MKNSNMQKYEKHDRSQRQIPEIWKHIYPLN